MNPPQSRCLGVVYVEFKLNSTPKYSNTHGLRWIHDHPNKASSSALRSGRKYIINTIMVRDI
jgi:hypothetical protein